MAQNSTAKISLTPAEAKALHRQLSAAIKYIEATPSSLIKDDKDVFSDIKTTKKVLGKISTALEKRSKTRSTR